MRTLSYFLIPVKVILADGGYKGEIIDTVKRKFGYLIQVVMSSDDRKMGFKPINKRWKKKNKFKKSISWLCTYKNDCY